jgi:hypothetical protein
MHRQALASPIVPLWALHSRDAYHFSDLLLQDQAGLFDIIIPSAQRIFKEADFVH